MQSEDIENTKRKEKLGTESSHKESKQWVSGFTVIIVRYSCYLDENDEQTLFQNVEVFWLMPNIGHMGLFSISKWLKVNIFLRTYI